MPTLAVIAGAYVAGVTAGAVLGGPWQMTALVAICTALAVFLATPRAHHVPVLLAVVLVAAAGHARIADLDAVLPPPLAPSTVSTRSLALWRATHAWAVTTRASTSP